MATIKTIKPDGSGDYTTLQAWEDWADGQSSADQWAECYSGGDLGGVSLSAWVATPDSTHYPRIYAAEGHRHNGTRNGTSGAYINVPAGNMGVEVNLVDYAHVEWMRFNITDGDSSRGVYSSLPKYTHVLNNLFDLQSITTNWATGIFLYIRSSTDQTCVGNVIRNNIFYGDNIAKNGAGMYMEARADGADNTITLDITIQNNSILNWVNNSGNAGIYYRTNIGNAGATGILNITATNNIIAGFSNGSCYLSYTTGSGTNTHNITQTYCMSSDDTSDDWGGDGNQINKSAAEVFESTSNLNLKTGSPAIGTGSNLYDTFTTDAIGTTRHVNLLWDMGALTTFVLGYYLYRGTGGIGSVNFDTPVASVAAGNSTKTFGGMGHSPATLYTYVLRPVRKDNDGNYLETPDFDCKVEFETDGGGDWIGNRPAAVEVLDAEVIDSAKILLRWQYRTPQDVIAPSDFGVYYSNCPHISTGSPNTTVNYTRDGQYTTTLNLADANTYYFTITARTSEAIESHPCPVVGPIVADGTAPNQPAVFTERTFY